MAEEGRVDKEAIIRALQEAMTMGEAGKTLSDADRMRMQRLKGMDKRQGMKPPERMKMKMMNGMKHSFGLSPAQIKMLEQMMKQQQGVRDAEERKAFPPDSMMNRGGEVQGYKPGGAVTKKTKKPKMGCVMKGRGGSYKGRK